MRLRFFNTFEPVSPFYRDLLPFLADHGHEIEVVVSSKEYRPGRTPLAQRLAHPRIHLRHIPAGRGVAHSRRQKVWAMVTYLVGATLLSLFGRRVDANFFLTQPPLFPLWGYLLRRLRDQPYICLVMDVYPDVAVRHGVLSAKSPLARALTAISRFALRHTDLVVVIGRCMKELLSEQGVNPEKIRVIPNWVNESEIHPVPRERNRLRRELGVDGDFVVLYSGNLGVSHFFDDILAAAERLKEVPGLQFVFAGEGARKREIVRAKEQKQLDNVIVLPFQPVERLAESLSMGDVHFLSLREGFTGLVVPSKAYGALGSGRPMIYQGEARGEIARMIVEEEVGAVVPLNDPERLTATILHYYQDSERVHCEGKRAYALNRWKYSRANALNKYLTLFERFTGRIERRAGEKRG